jgi:3-oxoacyl-[acyl-carrier protein] reductase
MRVKTIFITGGSRGIGEAVVRAAVGRYNVAFCYNQNEKKASELVEELKTKGSVFSVFCDVSSSASVKLAVEAVNKRFGRVDVLVNNAGICHSKLIQDVSDEEWRRVFSINTDGVFYTMREVLPQMISAKSGAIINIASMWGECGAAAESVYSASKAAVIGLSKAVAKEVAPSGVRVNAVSPGAVDTDMMKCYSKEEIAALCQDIPLGRLATPREIAEAVLFLAEADYITGQALSVNGGMVI